MQTPDDDFPYTSDDPSLAPLEDTSEELVMSSQQVNDMKAALRVAIGSALNGSDLLITRVRRMQAMQESVKPETISIDEDETSWDHLRYLLLGALFELPDKLQRAFASTGKASSRLYDLLSLVLSPVTDSWLFSPLKDQYDHAAARGEKVIDRLIMKGRIEEQNSRNIFQQKAINDLINEFVEYLVIKIKVQEIVERQGATMAGDVVGDFREESANVDAMLENKLKSIFRKNLSETPSAEPSPPPENPAEGGKQA